MKTLNKRFCCNYYKINHNIKHYNNKGFGTLLVSGILFMLAMIIMAVVLVTQKTPDMYAGETSLSVLKASAFADSYKMFLKTAARVSEWKSEERIMSNAGYSTISDCGSFGYTAWNNKTSSCYPDIKSEFMQAFNSYFKDVARNAYGIELQEYSSGISTAGNNHDNKHKIVVSFTKPIEIPLITKDFSVGIEVSPDYEYASFIPANPNHYLPNRDGGIDTIVIHYTATNLDNTIKTFQDSKNPKKRQSAHYIIDRDGSVIQTVKEKDVAYHAGCYIPEGLGDKPIKDCPNPDHPICSRPEFKDINSRSIGIELVNLGYDCKNVKEDTNEEDGKGNQNNANTYICKEKDGKYWEVYPKQQITALAKLVAYLVNKYKISKVHPTTDDDKNNDKLIGIIGHNQVTPCKQDPGPLFPWENFLKQVDYYSNQLVNSNIQNQEESNQNQGSSDQGPSGSAQEDEQTLDALQQVNKCDVSLTKWHRYTDGKICWRLTSTGIEYKRVDSRADCNENANVYIPKSKDSCVNSILKNSNLMDIINEKAEKYDIPTALIVATICTESGGRLEESSLIRYEEGHFKPTYKADCITKLKNKGVEESTAQKYCSKEFKTGDKTLCRAAYACSLGLGHILYPTAIELGFTQSPDTLVDNPSFLDAAANSIELIAKYIKQKSDETKLDPPKVAAAYNHGHVAKACPGDFSNSKHKDYEKYTNNWCLFSNPGHIDKFIKHYNNAVQKGLPQCIGFSALSSSIGTYYYTPSFSVDFNLDIPSLSKVISWANNVVKNYNIEKACNMNNKDYLISEIEDFNKKQEHDNMLENISLGICDLSAKKLILDLKTSLKRCSFTKDTNCLCPIKTTYGDKDIAEHNLNGKYNIHISTKTIDDPANTTIIQLSNKDVDESLAINTKMSEISSPSNLEFKDKGFQKALKSFGNENQGINKPNKVFIYFYNNSQAFKNGLFLFKKGDKYLYFNISESNKVKVEEYHPVERVCNLPEEFFNLCVKLPRKIPSDSSDESSKDFWKQLNLRFAIFIPDLKAPENPTYLNLDYDDSTKHVLVSWESENLNDTYGFNVYYNYEDIIQASAVTCPYKPEINPKTSIAHLYLWNSTVISNNQKPEQPGNLYINIDTKNNKETFYYVIDLVDVLNKCLEDNACEQVYNNNPLIINMNLNVLITAFDSEENENLYSIDDSSKTIPIQITTPNPAPD